MSGMVKKYSYKNISGLHFPDANAGDELTYAINLTNLGFPEGNVITNVDWITPNSIVATDPVVNSDKTEAHVKLATHVAGYYRIYVEITSMDLNQENKNRTRIMLRVI